MLKYEILNRWQKSQKNQYGVEMKQQKKVLNERIWKYILLIEKK